MTQDRDLEKLREAHQRWNEEIDEKGPARKEMKPEFVTLSGLPVNRLYTPLDTEDLDYESELGFPGRYPYTRGVQPTMYRGRFWTMRQYAGFASAEESNRRYRYLLEQGQTGLSVAFDLPTQIGYDSDHEIAIGEVGKVGVAIDSLEDIEILFKKIPLDKVSASMTINAPAAVLLAMYIAMAEKQGVPPEQLRGTIQNDILKEYSSRGTYIFPPKPSMRIITDTFAYCSEKVPLWNTISISGYHMREAGCTAVQEVAFTLSNAISYVQSALDAGLDVDEFGPRLAFFFCCHQDFFEEVAKFRAARRLWAEIMKNRFKAVEPRSMMIRFHTQTAGCSLTAQQPKNNIMRVAFQALAAVLGGTQSLHTNSMDEALCLPTEESVRIALRTQQVIAHELGVTNTIDPMAGSYYVESLTRRIYEEAADYIEEIDKMGGSVAAIERGYIQKEIQNAAWTYQKEVERQSRIVVGVNKFTMDEDPPMELMRVDPAMRTAQIERLQKLKARRDTTAVEKALKALEGAARGSDNLVPYIYDAVKAYGTLGEICGVLRKVFGEFQQSGMLG